MNRRLVRQVLPIAPIVVSQRNCEPALGLSPRRFLELVIERAIPHAKIGKLRAVRVDVLVEALIPTVEAAIHATPAPSATTADDEADKVLAAIGRKRAR